MKKNAKSMITLIFLAQILVSSAFLIVIGYGTPSEFDVGFGTAPVIDGVVNGATNEWSSAEKVELELFPDISNQTDGLSIELWVLQAEQDLYILARFDLNDHSSSEYDNEFLGILIANWNASLDFTDAKIVQFSNMSTNTYSYLDYYINNTVYYEDLNPNGGGAAKLEGNQIVYEFSMPVENDKNDNEDVYLDHRITFNFMIVFGKKTTSYSSGIIISNIISIELKFPPGGTELPIGELLMVISTIVIFSTIGAFFVFYIFRITRLKKEIERIRS
ncbi:MAG: hypothetical protein ACTSQW_01935 [Promethearchaeota archaeon]